MSNAEKPLTFKVKLGDSLHERALDVIDMADKHDKDVEFVYGDIKFIVSPGATVKNVKDQYEEKFEQDRQDYLASPEDAVEQAAAEAEKIQQKRQRVAKMIYALPDLEGMDMDQIVDWVMEFTDLMNAKGVSDPNMYKTAAYNFERAGYEADAFIAKPGEDPDPRLEEDKDCIGRYIVGQCIASWKIGANAPPNRVVFFGKEYKRKFNAAFHKEWDYKPRVDGADTPKPRPKLKRPKLQ